MIMTRTSQLGMPLSHLPNREGFRFVGIARDGETIDCKVARNEIGNHYVVDEINSEPVYSVLRGWLHHKGTTK